MEKYGGQAAASKRDKTDTLVQSFMDFIDGKDGDRVKEVEEDFSAPAASVANTPGMGNVTPPSAGNIGSGDTFGAKRKKSKKKQSYLSQKYDDWLKIKTL